MDTYVILNTVPIFNRGKTLEECNNGKNTEYVVGYMTKLEFMLPTEISLAVNKKGVAVFAIS